ncbi:protein of unknown function [Paraburkholderia kururiensis]
MQIGCGESDHGSSEGITMFQTFVWATSGALINSADTHCSGAGEWQRSTKRSPCAWAPGLKRQTAHT